jgi:hypothetical protein
LQSVWEHGRKLEISAFQWFPSLLGRKKKSEAATASANSDVFRKLRPPPYFKNNGTIAELAENQKPQSGGSNPRAGWKFLVEPLRWSNGYLCEVEVSNVIQVSFLWARRARERLLGLNGAKYAELRS